VTAAEPYHVERRPPTVAELRALNAAVNWDDLPADDGAGDVAHVGP